MRRHKAEPDTAPAGVGVVPCALGRLRVAVRATTGLCLQWLDGSGRRRAKAGRMDQRLRVTRGPKVARARKHSPSDRKAVRGAPQGDARFAQSADRDANYSAPHGAPPSLIVEGAGLLWLGMGRALSPDAQLGRIGVARTRRRVRRGEAAKDFANRVFLLTIGK